mmetsp:Transcript_3522/g.8935  ORF Transcript_3522/g.8935 Transcript_3522/m.8935 type:complete len:276 (+) Transcript_3522:1007-1834(+)
MFPMGEPTMAAFISQALFSARCRLRELGSVVRTTHLTVASILILYRKSTTFLCRASGSSPACRTQKTRSEQLDQTRLLRRMVESSSCSPPSCTTHHTSTNPDRRSVGSGTFSAPLRTMSARLYACTSLKSLLIRAECASFISSCVDQFTITVLGASPPSPAVWMSDVKPWSTLLHMMTCVKPRTFAASRCSRREFSTFLRSVALCDSTPGTTEPRMQRPRPPFSCLRNLRAPRWLIGRPASSRSILHIKRICGRQFFACVSEIFSSSMREVRARS